MRDLSRADPDLIIGGLFYLAALVVVARSTGAEAAVPEAAPGRVVLGH
jgi:hypothetical protein